MYETEKLAFPLCHKWQVAGVTCHPPLVTCHLFYFLASAISAARNVFCMSMAMVIGPTPPGTGVIAPATSAADS